MSTTGREEKLFGPYVHKEKVLHERNRVEPLEMVATEVAIAYRRLEDLCRADPSRQTLDKHESKTGHVFEDCGREERKWVVLWSCYAGPSSASRMETKK